MKRAEPSSSVLHAEVIAIGSEMLFSGRIDTNSSYIALQLERYGIGLLAKSVVADDIRVIRDSLAQALSRAGLIFLTGGLGPTEDDLTRQAVSEQLGLEMVYHPEIVEQIEKRFRRLGRTMSEINKRQGFVLSGARVLPNRNGTAPGQCLRFEGRYLFLLPGPPSELQPMVDEHLPPLLNRLGLQPRARRYFRIAGLPESQVDATVSPIYRQYPEIQSTILASPGDIELFFFAADEGPRLQELASRVQEALGAAIFALDEITLEAAVGDLLREKGLTLAVAESCTGGMLAEWITRVPGSSSFFLGGVVAYNNRVKQRLLDVPAGTLRSHGAVSAEVAEAMALAACRQTGADLALSITGIAGPGGGSAEKPVGTVFVGCSDGRESRSVRHQFFGGRQAIRMLSTRSALNLLRRELLSSA